MFDPPANSLYNIMRLNYVEIIRTHFFFFCSTVEPGYVRSTMSSKIPLENFGITFLFYRLNYLYINFFSVIPFRFDICGFDCSSLYSIDSEYE